MIERERVLKWIGNAHRQSTYVDVQHANRARRVCCPDRLAGLREALDALLIAGSVLGLEGWVLSPSRGRSEILEDLLMMVDKHACDEIDLVGLELHLG